MREVLREKMIAVLYGGLSSEREVSLNSGRAITTALEEAGYTVKPFDVRESNLCTSLKEEGVDVVFIALHGGFGEDGQLQKSLESESIRYTGSGVEASRIAMNKLYSKEKFVEKHVPTPDWKVIRREDSLDVLGSLAENVGFPVVLKPISEGSSVGVSIHSAAGSLATGLVGLFEHGETGLVEKCIVGRELTVGILDDTALPVIEMRPKGEFFDYAAKYVDRTTEYIVNPRLEKADREAVQRAALAAFNAIGCRGFGRVDVILDERHEPWILEINTVPGFTERSLFPKAALAQDIGFVDLCERILVLALHS